MLRRTLTNKAFGWSYNDPARTVTVTTPTGKTTTTVASTRGLASTVTEPSGQQTTFNTYDAEGRLTQKTDGVGTTNYTYWPNGLPKDVTENGRTTTRTYDALNRLSQYQDGEGNTISYTYHPSGELATIVYPGNKTVTYGYDDFGRLHTVLDWASRTTTYTYDNASRLTRLDRPNGTYRIQEYDAASQLRFIKEYKSSGVIITFQELRYDNDGRITYNFIHPKPAAVTLAQDDLLYDDDNRLSAWNSQTAVFDADGNMTTGPLPSGAISANNYSYDARNRLISAGGSNYRYSPDGSRVEITGTGAARFVIDPNATLSRMLTRTKGGTITYYVYGLGLLYEEANGTPKYYHTDQVGSTLAMTDSGQTITDTWAYAPYGAIASRTGSTDTPFQFNGELGVQTDTNGLYHMRARYYNPRLMRFVNADPIGFDGGMNWYVGFGNNPLSNADPDGTNPTPFGLPMTPSQVIASSASSTPQAQQMRAIAEVNTAIYMVNSIPTAALAAGEFAVSLKNSTFYETGAGGGLGADLQLGFASYSIGVEGVLLNTKAYTDLSPSEFTAEYSAGMQATLGKLQVGLYGETSFGADQNGKLIDDTSGVLLRKWNKEYDTEVSASAMIGILKVTAGADLSKIKVSGKRVEWIKPWNPLAANQPPAGCKR